MTPLRYFADPTGWEEAHARALDWRVAHESAYRAHFRRVARLATETLSDLLPAATASEVLRTFNGNHRNGRPVGREALERLERAVAQIEQLPRAPEAGRARTAGVTLGRLPGVFAEAPCRCCGDPAVEVQRRRTTV